MKSPYAFPAVCAATVHLAFLWGGAPERPHRMAPPPPIDDVTICDLVFPPEPEPDEVVEVVENDALFPPGAFEPVDAIKAPDPLMPPPIDPVISPHTNPEVVIQVRGALERWLPQIPRGDGVGDPNGRFQRIQDLATLDKIPAARLRVSPRYPEAMRREGREAEVVVTFVVNRDGRVIEARGAKGADVEFAREAERAVLRWRFEPGTRRGQPVSFRMSVPLVFSIDGADRA